VVNSANDLIVPQVVDGDSWKTTIFLTSLEPSDTIYFNLAFYSDSGFPLILPLVGVGSTASGSAALPPNWSTTIETQGTGATLQQGWAVVSTFDRPPGQPGARQIVSRIAGMAVFRQRIPGRPDFEAVVPFSPMNETRFVMPFDNRNDFSTGIAWLNPNLTTPAPVEVTIQTADARILRLDSFTLAPGSKVVFSMPDRYPESRGQTGSILVRTSSRSLSGLGLRFNPTGAFTSFHTLSAAQ
jgi:hypothetical protein